jgi:hypothetical protein
VIGDGAASLPDRIVVEHLRKLPGFDPRVFPWNHDRATLDDEFTAI